MLNKAIGKILAKWSTRLISTNAPLVAIGFVLLLAANPGQASLNHADRGPKELAVCYAIFSDVLALAPAEEYATREEDPNYRKGLAGYRDCMTRGWTIDVVFNGVVITTVALEDWVMSIYDGARNDGVLNTQHLLGTCLEEARDGRGTVQCYAQVTTAYLDPNTGFPANVLQLAGITYTHHTRVNRNGVTKIRQSVLELTSSYFNAPTPPTP